MTQTKTSLLGMEALGHAAGCLRTVAHPHRLRMIQMLLGGSYTVGELAEACAIPPSSASEHLGKMRDRGLLVGKRNGRMIYYEIAEEGLGSIMKCIETRFGE
ncbi:MAG: winged helix-turn-helix transcriptional regulator [Planctomycetes bacterium]|nr:winged helix-turn-helix transcriptional regulator [Planctomycetota bacterium]